MHLVLEHWFAQIISMFFLCLRHHSGLRPARVFIGPDSVSLLFEREPPGILQSSTALQSAKSSCSSTARETFLTVQVMAETICLVELR